MSAIAFVLSCQKVDYQGVMTEFSRFKEWCNMQGGAIYGDKLICLTATDRGTVPNGFIYDLITDTLICSMTFTSTIDGQMYSMPHANQVSFGTFFYNTESDFPLLYVSQVNGGNGRNDISGERGVLVYNLRYIGNNQYMPELVQSIIPNQNDNDLMKKIGFYTPNYIVDTDKNRLVVIGYPNESWYDLNGAQPVAILGIPDIIEKEYIFSDKDILNSFLLPRTVATQQSFYYDGKIFSSGGDAGQASLRVIDIDGQKEEYYMDMSVITKGEPQFLGLWKDKVLYYEYGYDGIVYEIVIPGYGFAIK